MMFRGRSNGFGARWQRGLGVAAGGVALLVAVADRASTASGDPTSPAFDASEATGRPAEGPGPWLSIGLLTGTTQLDAGLADYQWNTTLRLAGGAQALAGTGRFAAGLRLWRTRTTQAVGGLAAPLDVRATSFELVGEAALAEKWGARLLATAGAGRLHIGYDPDQITIQPTGPSPAVVVDFAPVDAWIGGGGLALRRPLAKHWTAGIGVDHRVFALDTAHRVGTAIALGRETFGDWSARLELAWLHHRR